MEQAIINTPTLTYVLWMVLRDSLGVGLHGDSRGHCLLTCHVEGCLHEVADSHCGTQMKHICLMLLFLIP